MATDKRWRNKGRQQGPTFVRLPHFVLRSPQWVALSGTAIKLLLELAGQYNGRNNGDLSATYTDMKARGWASNDTLQRALRELEAGAWIVRTRQGGRHIGCNLYALSWEPVDSCDGKHQHPVSNKASHAWKNAIGRPDSGQRKAGNRTARPVGIRKPDSEIVRLRPAA